MWKFIIGVVVGVWLASSNPEATEWIRTQTQLAYDFIVVEGSAFVDHVEEYESPEHSPPKEEE